MPKQLKRESMMNQVIDRPLSVEAELDSLRVLRVAERVLAGSGLRPIAGGAAGAWTFTNGVRTSMLNGTFDFDTDTFKMALFLSTSNLGAASTAFSGVTNEHAAAAGYTAGGIACTIALSGTTTVKVDETTNPVWTASGGSIVARFAAIYEVGGNIVCYCLLDDAPADVTATTGNTLTVTIHANGLFGLS